MTENSLLSIEEVNFLISSVETSSAADMNGIPQVIRGVILLPSGVYLHLKDAPEVRDWVQIWRTWRPLHNLPMPGNNFVQITSSKPCSMRRSVIVHENKAFTECQAFGLMPWIEVLFQEVNVNNSSHFYTIMYSEWPNKLASNNPRIKHHTTTSLLTSK